MRKIAIFLGGLPLAFAAPAYSQVFAGSGRTNDLVEATDGLHRAVNNLTLTNEQVANHTYQFSNVGLPSTQISFRVKMHPWGRYAVPENKNATVATIMREGDKALRAAKTSPSTEVADAAQQAVDMFGAGKIDFGRLGDNQAGEYQYKPESKDLGHIDLNEFMKVMARIVPPKLLYATVIHEARHAKDHQDGQLSPNEVKKGEISAFHTEYEYLASISTDGQEINMAWRSLDDEAKSAHNPLVARAADYVFSLVALYRTKGDGKRILEYVDKMGYQEGSGRVKTAPFSS